MGLVAALGAALVGALAFTADPAPAVTHPGLEFVRRLQERAGFLTPLAQAVTTLGDIEFYVLVFPFLYWSLQRRLGIVAGVALLLSAGLNSILKLAFHTPRPSFIDPSLELRPESTFGIPSGHAQNGVVIWGLLAAEARTRAVWAAAIAFIVALSWTRMHLGVHFAQDILVGWLVGALLLGTILRWRAPVGAWIAARSPRQQRLLAFGASSALIAAAGAVRFLSREWVVPGGWIGVDPTEPPMSLEAVVTTAAALFGFGAGIVFVRERGGFDTAGRVVPRLLRYLVGLVGVAAIFLGLDAVLPDGADPVALVYRYVQFGLLGFWIGGVAPLVFVRLGIAPRADGTRWRAGAETSTEDPSLSEPS
ncbi:MAG: phosphatase PAP2 family protein [Nitriliruptorales bacterium]